jgi:ribosome biogenesis protein SSF1/2
VNNGHRIPSLKNLDDIADLLLGKNYQGYSSESELEDLPDSKVTLGQDYQGKASNSNIALRLHEVGPRMTLELMKI